MRATALLLLVLLLGCGKYGSPVRASASAGSAGASGVTLDHAASCDDPEHDHQEKGETP